jgi:HK97 family phage major capsid protein
LAQQVLLLPKELGTILPVSNRLLRDAGQEVADAIFSDLSEVLGLRLDLAFTQGTGTGAEPLGIKNKSGTLAGPSLGANGGTPTFDNLKAIVAGLRSANAPFLSPGWVFNPRLLSTLETVKDTTGRYLADVGLLEFDATGGGGKLLGFPFRTTTQIPVTMTTGTSADTTYIIFSSDWRDAVWVGINQNILIEYSREAAYTTDGGTTTQYAWQQRQTVYRAEAAADIGLRRPGLVSVTTGVRP